MINQKAIYVAKKTAYIIAMTAIVTIIINTSPCCESAHAIGQDIGVPESQDVYEQGYVYTYNNIGWGCPIEGPIRTITRGPVTDALGWVNYFIPLSEMAGIMTLWLIAIGVYYLSSIFLRWIKAVS